MSRKGNCWDNAVAESFFASLNERACAMAGITKLVKEAQQDILNYLTMFYNSQRLNL